MVPAAVVMGAAAGIVTRVPNLFQFSHGLRLFPVHGFHQRAVHLFAELHPRRVNLKGLVEKIVLAGDDVDKVPDAARRMVRAIEVNINSAALSWEAGIFCISISFLLTHKKAPTNLSASIYFTVQMKKTISSSDIFIKSNSSISFKYKNVLL